MVNSTDTLVPPLGHLRRAGRQRLHRRLVRSRRRRPRHRRLHPRPHLPAGAQGEQAECAEVDLDRSKKASLAALASPNLAVRYMAMAKLQSMDARRRPGRCSKPAATQKDNPSLRARAFWQLGRPASAGQQTGRRLPSKSEDPRFRILAMRILKDVLRASRPADYSDPTGRRRCCQGPVGRRSAARPLLLVRATSTRQGQAADPRPRQAIRRQGPLLSRSHRHRGRPSRQGPPRRDPCGLRQGIPRLERQGRRSGLGAATAVGAAVAGQAPGRQVADAGPARPHRGHPGRGRRQGGRRRAAEGAGNRCAAGGPREGHRQPQAVPAEQVARPARQQGAGRVDRSVCSTGRKRA